MRRAGSLRSCPTLSLMAAGTKTAAAAASTPEASAQTTTCTGGAQGQDPASFLNGARGVAMESRVCRGAQARCPKRANGQCRTADWRPQGLYCVVCGLTRGVVGHVRPGRAATRCPGTRHCGGTLSSWFSSSTMYRRCCLLGPLMAWVAAMAQRRGTLRLTQFGHASPSHHGTSRPASWPGRAKAVAAVATGAACACF